MKKFKHTPSGITVEQTVITGRSSGFAYRTPEGYNLPHWIVEEGSDWEEVKERTWEAESYINQYGAILVRAGFKTEPWENFCDNSWATLHSVRRLSDGEVFTVGDFITYKGVDANSWGGSTGLYGGCNIESFSVRCDNIFINEHYKGGNDRSISDWVKVTEPKVLFTTEDGHAITQPNLEVYSVCTKSDWETRKTTYQKYGNARHGTAFTEASPWKHFHSKEKRDDYILRNKPCLSLADIENKTVGFPYKYTLLQIFSSVARKRLNQ